MHGDGRNGKTHQKVRFRTRSPSPAHAPYKAHRSLTRTCSIARAQRARRAESTLVFQLGSVLVQGRCERRRTRGVLQRLLLGLEQVANEARKLAVDRRGRRAAGRRLVKELLHGAVHHLDDAALVVRVLFMPGCAQRDARRFRGSVSPYQPITYPTLPGFVASCRTRSSMRWPLRTPDSIASLV